MDLPLRKLEKLRGKTVTVRLKNNVEITGSLAVVDTFINLVLEKSVMIGDSKTQLGDIFLRGNNVLFVRIDSEK
ncbi:MAG: LSM domain-containing protein [Promethearchaeota archaeon]